MEKISDQELYAQLYDIYVQDWPGEVNFYRELITHAHLTANGVLEIACGTGRITLLLAKEGINMTGLDVSPELLERAREKSSGMTNVKWIQGDMRTFEIEEKFGIAIMPGHSFQAMNTPDEQVQCLEHIKHHLIEGGLLVVHLDHQDIVWLAGLLDGSEPASKNGLLLRHPTSAQEFRKNYTWTFEPSTQTATVKITWEQVSKDGTVLQFWEMEPMRLHCIFRFEMEHLLRRVGFSVEAVYGDFFKNLLTNSSREMIWVAKKRINLEQR